MKFSIESKKEIIDNKPDNMSVKNYCNQIGISCAAYYKWAKQMSNANETKEFIDVTSLASSNDYSYIMLSINNIDIKIDPNFNEILLKRIIRTLTSL